jgi:hypothetical protein
MERTAGAPGERECRANVGVSPGGGQTGLRRPVPDAAKNAPDGQAHLARQIVGLVEAPLQSPDGMQGDGNHRVRP